MSPSGALESCETALRQLLVHVLSGKHGTDWMNTAFTAPQLADLETRRQYEQKKRTTRGVAVVSEALIDYTHFYDLLTLAERNWSLVAPALGKQAATAALLRRMDDLRNTVAHNRRLRPFEEDLIAGIAGEIRNRVTVYMSKQDEAGEHYPRIEDVVDSFGNRIDGLATLQSSHPSVDTGLVLNVGQVVTFQGRASDPHDRTLTWELMTFPASNGGSVVATGNEVELQWTVAPEHVSARTGTWVTVTSDSPWHRWPNGFDGFTGFNYRVDPPAP